MANPFLEWFGHAFEEYGGILLRMALDPSTVHSEPAYGRSVKHGPDWTVLGEEIGLALEFRSSRLPKSVRSTTERDEIINRVGQVLGHTASLLPKKIQDILDGSAGLDATGTSALIPGIVTVESWYPETLIAHLIQEELQKTGVEAGRFQLMSISDLEWLLTWAQFESPAVVLRDKLSDPTQDDVPLREYLSKRAKDQGQSFPQRILKERADSFFDQLTGLDAQTGDQELQ